MLKALNLLAILLLHSSDSVYARSHGLDLPAVVLDQTVAQLSSEVDDSVRTNLDSLSHSEEESNAASIDGQNLPEFKVTPERAGEPVRVSRQVANPLHEHHLFFCNREFLVFINRDGTGLKAFQSGTPNVIACDYDIRDNFMFWSDVSRGHIARAKMDGTELTILIQTGITTPDGIAWDWVNSKLYWTDADERDIEVYEPATGSRSVLIVTGAVGQSIPRAIVLDPVDSRKMYWTDWGTSPKIERANLDGSSRQTLHSTNLIWPNALTIDIPTQTLYWADAGLDRLECSRADGTGRRLLIGQFILHPFGMDFFNGTLYWTDWQYKAVLNSTIHHTTTQPTFTIYGVISGLRHDPMGIRVVSMQKQPLAVTNTPPICNPKCENGAICSEPGVCICTKGWSGSQCQEPVCTQLCSNGGSCTAPDTCSCVNGWKGDMCTVATCTGGCTNGGACIIPETCSCPSGWTGTSCTQPVCSQGCEHGSCTGPNTCTCQPGWTGPLCDKGVCLPQCENGDCVRPNECVCDPGWQGRLCTERTW